MKRCRCCSRVYSLADVVRLSIGWQRFDDVSLLLFNCECIGTTLAVEVPNPRIRFLEETHALRS